MNSRNTYHISHHCAIIIHLLLAASSCFAWMPKTHLYLSEIALEDALTDSKVDIFDTNGILIGHYACNPDLITAISANTTQFRAGVSGAEAYPDMVTGRELISPSYPGTDTWLNYLWSTTSGSKGADRAFTAGYMASAAGDLFGSSFTNYYAGGSTSDGSTAPKQELLQHVADNQMPQTQKYDGSGVLKEKDMSIQGDADQYVYEKMINSKPGSVLRDLLAGKRVDASIPAVYSSLKNGLTNDTAYYHDKVRDLEKRYEEKKKAGDNCAILDLTCSKLLLYAEAGGLLVARDALVLTQKPIILYKEAWIKDIESGLRAWPAVSHEINLSLHCGDSVQTARARNAASQFVSSHLISMAGAPDVLGTTFDFVNSVLVDILPPFMRSPIASMKNELLDFMITRTTGKNAGDWSTMAENPESQLQGAGVNTADYRENGLKTINPSDTIKYQDVSAMRNTVTMIKLSLMSKGAVNQLLQDLGSESLLAEDNVMLGSWFGSLDESKQWASSCRKQRMVFAKTDSIFYKIFKHQPGDNDEYCTSGTAAVDSFKVLFNTPMAGGNDMKQDPPVNRHLYKLTMPYDGSLHVACNDTDHLEQPFLTLTEQDSVTILANGRVNPSSPMGMLLDIPNLRKGSYILELFFYNPTSYTLIVSPGRHLGNDTEPNDSARFAMPLAGDSTIAGWVGDAGGYRSDLGDWYAITVANAVQYNLSMICDTTMTPKLVLYDQDSVNELAEGYAGVAGYTALKTPLLSKGAYYLWVTGYGFGSYSLTSSTVVGCSADPEPNNAVSQSTELIGDSVITAKLGQVGGGSTDDNDWYAITINSGSLRIKLESSPDLYASLTLYGKDSSSVLESNYETTSEKVFTMSGLSSGTYFVNVHLYVGQGCYQLTAQSVGTGTARNTIVLSDTKPSVTVGAQAISYSFAAQENGNASVMVYNMRGQVKAGYAIGSVQCGQKYSGSLATSRFPKGMYCLRLTNGESVIAAKRVLVR
jgi:hypothetical protein